MSRSTPRAHRRRMAVLGVVLGAIVVVATACGGASTSGASPAQPTSDTSAAAPSPAGAATEAPPATSAAASDAGPSPAAAAGGDDAARTVAILDELAALDDPTLEQLVAWFDKAFNDPIADQTIPAFFDYIAAREAFFQALQQGESIKGPMADLLATRDPIAALAGIAAVGPRATPSPTAKPDRADYATPTAAEWTSIIGDPTAHVGERYVVASCIATPAALDALVGESWFEWRDDYWEGDLTAFTTDEETVTAIVEEGKRLIAYVTVMGEYPVQFRDNELVPHFQLDDREPPRDCRE